MIKVLAFLFPFLFVALSTTTTRRLLSDNVDWRQYTTHEMRDEYRNYISIDEEYPWQGGEILDFQSRQQKQFLFENVFEVGVFEQSIKKIEFFRFFSRTLLPIIFDF